MSVEAPARRAPLRTLRSTARRAPQVSVVEGPYGDVRPQRAAGLAADAGKVAFGLVSYVGASVGVDGSVRVVTLWHRGGM